MADGESAADWRSPLVAWGDADLVYVAYGKIWFPLFLAFTLCAFLIYKQRRPGLWETWVWRLTLTGYMLACAGVFLEYWTQWTGAYNVVFEIGWMVIVPALLLTMVGSTVLGVTLLVRGSAPRVPVARSGDSAGVVDLASHLPGQCGAPGDIRVRDPRASDGIGICGGGAHPGRRGLIALMGVRHTARFAAKVPRRDSGPHRVGADHCPNPANVRPPRPRGRQRPGESGGGSLSTPWQPHSRCPKADRLADSWSVAPPSGWVVVSCTRMPSYMTQAATLSVRQAVG
jgi:hypothetical protein